MRPRLTERQAQVYDFVRDHLRKEGRPPTLIEIGRALALRSTNGVHRLVSILVDKGYLVRTPLASRGLALPADDPLAPQASSSRLPLASRASSRDPTRVRPRFGREILVDPVLLGGARLEECLVAPAGDDAMIDEAIRKGDFLVVQQQAIAALRAGDLVAVLYEQMFVARRLEAAGSRLVVSTSGPAPTADVIVPPDPSRHVVGAVRGMIRPFDS
jgi:repressor LexA